MLVHWSSVVCCFVLLFLDLPSTCLARPIQQRGLGLGLTRYIGMSILHSIWLMHVAIDMLSVVNRNLFDELNVFRLVWVCRGLCIVVEG